jgi:hypothetical protein
MKILLKLCGVARPPSLSCTTKGFRFASCGPCCALCFNPKSLHHDGVAGSDNDGRHLVVLTLEFWIEEGVMHFFAPVLPFTLGIPIILDIDFCHLGKRKKSPIANLPYINIARLADLEKLHGKLWQIL